MSPLDSAPADLLREHRRYYRLRQGDGGIYRVPVTYSHPDGMAEQWRAIATTACRTCVGISFLVADHNFFVAHMDGHVLNESDAETSEWVTTRAQGDTLQEEIVKKLRRMFPDIVANDFPNHLKAKSPSSVADPTLAIVMLLANT